MSTSTDVRTGSDVRTTRDGAGAPAQDWVEGAACRAVDPDTLFVRGAEQHQAKQVCRTCPVRTECLAEALDSRSEFGVWGGMTERERRAVLRRSPDVTSWRTLLTTARDEYERGVALPLPQRRATA